MSALSFEFENLYGQDAKTKKEKDAGTAFK